MSLDAPETEWDEELLADLHEVRATAPATEERRPRRRRTSSSPLTRQWAGALGGAQGVLSFAPAGLDDRTRAVFGLRAATADVLACLFFFAAQTMGNESRTTVGGLAGALACECTHRDAWPAILTPPPSTLAACMGRLFADTARAGLQQPLESFTQLLRSEHLTPALDLAREACGTDGPPSVDDRHQLNEEGLTVFRSVPPSGRSLTALLDEMESRVGMAEVKHVVRGIVAETRMTAELRRRGVRAPSRPRHMVFTGNPGTGKTTVAREVADLLHGTGLLPGAPFVETDRAGLIGIWLGSAGRQVTMAVEAALGGVLFIDEAHAFAGGPDGPDKFAVEAIDCLVKAMEDHRDRLVVILAGYPDGIDRLLGMNPGLASRIGRRVHFADYTVQDLAAILAGMAEQRGLLLDDDARAAATGLFEGVPRGESFGNARLARQALDAALEARDLRLASDPAADLTAMSTAALITVTADDLAAARQAITGPVEASEAEPASPRHPGLYL